MNRELAEVVAERLEAKGWALRDLQERCGVTLTRGGGGGVLLVVQLLPTSLTFPGRRHRPETHWLRVGAGYGPALDLMPLLTLPARPILVDGPAETVTVDGSDDELPAVDRIVAAVDEHAAAVAARFPELPALVEAVSDQERLVLLAALGRVEEVRALLTDAELSEDEPAERRFVRQLTRRLEQGLPPAPPVEQTLAIVAPDPEPWPDRRTLWARARTQNRRERAAYRAARRQAAGRTRDQIKDLLDAEFRVRGVDPDASDVAMRATMIGLRRRPFGRVRAAVATAALLGGGIRDLIRMVRSPGSSTRAADPDRLRPPDRASYPVPTGSRYVTVDVNGAGRALLEQAREQAARRFGPWVLVDAWLTRGPADRLNVHIGQQPVGTVEDGTAFDGAFTAAALFDEDPVLTARLVPDPEPILELPLPRPTAAPI